MRQLPNPIFDNATLRALRQRHGVAQCDMARLVGVSRSTLNRWECSNMRLPHQSAQLMALVFWYLEREQLPPGAIEDTS